MSNTEALVVSAVANLERVDQLNTRAVELAREHKRLKLFAGGWPTEANRAAALTAERAAIAADYRAAAAERLWRHAYPWHVRVLARFRRWAA